MQWVKSRRIETDSCKIIVEINSEKEDTEDFKAGYSKLNNLLVKAGMQVKVEVVSKIA